MSEEHQNQHDGIVINRQERYLNLTKIVGRILILWWLEGRMGLFRKRISCERTAFHWSLCISEENYYCLQVRNLIKSGGLL